MKFIAASVVFFIFVFILNEALDKVMSDHRKEIENDPILMKRYKRWSRTIGTLGILSFVLLAGSIIYCILK